MIELPGAASSAPEPIAPVEPIVRAGRAVARLAKAVEGALASAELTLAQYRVLAHLSRGNAAPSRLAGGLAVSRPTVTALLDGLRARGLVERRPDPEDGRRASHELTPSGRAALDAADRAVADRLQVVAEHLPDTAARAGLVALAEWDDAVDRVLEARAADRTRQPS